MRLLQLGDVVFLEVSDVEDGHARGLAEGEGSPGVRDSGLLESAVMAPRTGYYGSLAELAAVYAFGIAKNHAFIDGNKRAALIAALLFLEVNGYPLTLERDRWRVIVEGSRRATSRARRSPSTSAPELGDPIFVFPDA